MPLERARAKKDRREFAPDPSSAREARRFVQDGLRYSPWAHIANDVGLAASELVTNAVLHAGTSVTVTISRADDGVLLEVTDGDARPVPVPSSTSLDARPDFNSGDLEAAEAALSGESMSGRGLLIVAGVATAWGVRVASGGKTVWARFGASAGGVDGEGENLTDDRANFRPARLVAVPTRLAIESEANLEDVERELQFVRLDDADAIPVVLADRALGLLARARDVRHRMRESAHLAVSESHRLCDVDLTMPPDSPATLWQLIGVLEQLSTYSRDGALLSLEPGREVVAFRRWLGAEIERQARGEPPVPPPFPVLAVDDEGLREALLTSQRELSGAITSTVGPESRRLALAAATLALDAADDVPTIAEVALRAAFDGVAAVNGSLCLLRPDGVTVEISAAIGYGEAVTGHWGEFPVNADLPASEAIRTRHPLLLRTPAERIARYPALGGGPLVGSQALAVIPVATEDSLPYGALVLGFAAALPLTDELPFLEAISGAAAVAIQRLRREASADEERAGAAFLERVERGLRSCRSIDEAMSMLSQLAVPRLGDWLSVHVAAPDVPRLVAVEHADRAKRNLAEKLHRKWPPHQTSGSAITAAFESGQGLLFQVVPVEALERIALDEEHLETLRALGFGSGMVVPVAKDGVVLAALAIANETGRIVTPEDHALAIAMAERVAAIVSNLDD